MAAMRAYPPRRADNLRGWVLTIAHNKAMDHHRRRARHAVPVADVPEVAVWDGEPGGDEVWERVRSLPDKQRAAVTLRYAADLSHREVAAAMGTSEEAARRSAHEGLKRLRLELTA
jgi:RNA polymerase sigma factor (sigma-70 family)